MFELLTGRLPFSGESAVSIALKHLQSETPSPTRWNPDIPQSFENIVLKATAKDPFLRYGNAEEMERDLETALDRDRINEPKFVIPEDIDATKAIPVITGNNNNLHSDTVLHEKDSFKNGQEAQSKPKRKKWPWVIGIFIGLLLLSLIFFTTVLPAMRDAQNVKVPDIIGEEYDDAVVKVISVGLIVGVKEEIPSMEVPEGRVIRTSLKAESEVKRGSSIDIYVTLGKKFNSPRLYGSSIC